ncbi:MAG: choice-of-anchor V domain-containing protein, partial [Flavobacteriales bacterium]
MKKLINLGLLGALCLIFLSSSFSLQDDPDGKAGASGAPSETTCNDTDCHNSFAVNSGSGSITISSTDLTDWAYVPGTTYTISITVEQAAINLFGLCFEALKPNGDNAGTLHAGIGTQIKNKTVGGFQRKSITHNNNTGASANTHTFTFTLDAPATDIGDITFYVAGLAANGDDHESDDRVYSTLDAVTT